MSPLMEISQTSRGSGNNGSGPCAKQRARRRRSHPYSVLFEAVACSHRGNKLNGLTYRNGSKLAGFARCYQFRDTEPGAEADGDSALHDPPLSILVKQRLRAMLSQADIDLVYLRFCAGWSQASVARKLGCWRSIIKRREERILRQLRADEALRRAALGECSVMDRLSGS